MDAPNHILKDMSTAGGHCVRSCHGEVGFLGTRPSKGGVKEGLNLREHRKDMSPQDARWVRTVGVGLDKNKASNNSHVCKYRINWKEPEQALFLYQSRPRRSSGGLKLYKTKIESRLALADNMNK